MSVRIVRTKSGEDVICDLYEVTTKDDNDKVIALQLRNPYQIYISAGMDIETDGEVHKVSSPDINFEPWAPLAKERTLMIKLDEVVSAYETYDEVIEKYNELIGAVEHGPESSSTEKRESE